MIHLEFLARIHYMGSSYIEITANYNRTLTMNSYHIVSGITKMMKRTAGFDIFFPVPITRHT